MRTKAEIVHDDASSYGEWWEKVNREKANCEGSFINYFLDGDLISLSLSKVWTRHVFVQYVSVNRRN